MSTEGIVFDIKEFAVFDGPGIRTTVFMKGCPLHCMWCHNPEGLSREPEIMVSAAACVHCGRCAEVCPETLMPAGASADLTGLTPAHPENCTLCGKCIPVCKGGLRKIAGTRWTADALAARLKKDRDVYALSDGGVTFSGGEPFLQWEFVSEVLRELRDAGIHTAIETSGFTSDEHFREAMELCSLIMMDWKVSDPELHKRYTGVSQEPIRKHAEMLVSGNTPFMIRMPLIPGVNDNRAHFETAASLVKDAAALVRVDLLPYQRAAGAKYEMVGKKYEVDFDETKKLQMFEDVFRDAGIPYQRFR